MVYLAYFWLCFFLGGLVAIRATKKIKPAKTTTTPANMITRPLKSCQLEICW